MNKNELTNQHQPKTEGAIKVTMVEGKVYHIFSDRSGGLITKAESRLESAHRGVGSTFIRAHTGKDRYSEATNANSRLVLSWDAVTLPVPESITKLYITSQEVKDAGEDEDKLNALFDRLGHIRDYFDTV